MRPGKADSDRKQNLPICTQVVVHTPLAGSGPAEMTMSHGKSQQHSWGGGVIRRREEGGVGRIRKGEREGSGRKDGRKKWRDGRMG
jgi:hypothetical protein